MFSILPLPHEIASWWERKNKEIKRQWNSIGASFLIINTIKSWPCSAGEATVKLRRLVPEDALAFGRRERV